jgi:hypothetical protein
MRAGVLIIVSRPRRADSGALLPPSGIRVPNS